MYGVLFCVLQLSWWGDVVICGQAERSILSCLFLFAHAIPLPLLITAAGTNQSPQGATKFQIYPPRVPGYGKRHPEAIDSLILIPTAREPLRNVGCSFSFSVFQNNFQPSFPKQFFNPAFQNNVSTQFSNKCFNPKSADPSGVLKACEM